MNRPAECSDKQTQPGSQEGENVRLIGVLLALVFSEFDPN